MGPSGHVLRELLFSGPDCFVLDLLWSTAGLGHYACQFSEGPLCRGMVHVPPCSLGYLLQLCHGSC